MLLWYQRPKVGMLSPTATASVDVVQKWAFIAGTGFDTSGYRLASGCRPHGAGVIFENAVSSEVGPCSLFFRGAAWAVPVLRLLKTAVWSAVCNVPRHIVRHPRVVCPAERRTQVLHVTATLLLCGMICPRDRLLAAVL